MNQKPNSTSYIFVSILLGLIVFAVSHLHRFTFPYPFIDDDCFFVPAAWWAAHTDLNPVTINAPRGIFWVQDGFTIVLGLYLKVFGQSIIAAKLFSRVLVSCSVLIFSLQMRRITRSNLAGIVFSLILLSPPLIFAANTVRMESVMFFVLAIALLLHINDLRLEAALLLILSMLVHPALAMASVLYTVAILTTMWLERSFGRISPIRRMVLVVMTLCVGIAFASEAVHTLAHQDLFRQHMAFQVAQKSSRGIAGTILKPQGAIFLMCAVGLVATLARDFTRGRKANLAFSVPLALLVMGMFTYAVLGGEVVYNVYSCSIGPALTFALCYRSLAMDARSYQEELEPAFEQVS